MAERFVVQYEINDLAEVDGTNVPTRFTVTLQRDGGPDVVAEFVLRDGAPRCRELRVVSTDDGREVRSADCARVRVSDLLEQGFAAVAMPTSRADESGRWLPPEPPPEGQTTKQRAVLQVRSMRRQGRRTPDDTLLQEVAEVYRRNLGNNPTESVAEHFGRKHRTAALRVQQARQRGFLGAAIRGKAGEQS